MPGEIRNVLLFLTDQQRKDSIAAYGNPVARTPNIDRLAGEGVRFERCYTQNPFCSPARASILTGLHPRQHGVWHNGIPFDIVGAPTLGDMLAAHGCRTGSVGKIHLGPWMGEGHPATGYEESEAYWKAHPEMADWHGPYVGFQEVDLVWGHEGYSHRAGHYGAYLKREFPEGVELLKRESSPRDPGHHLTWPNAIPEKHHYNTWIADRTIEMIDRFAGEPFFIHCSFPDPHHAFTACEPYASMYRPADMPEPIPASAEELAAMPPHYLRAYENGRHGPPFEEGIAGEPLRHIMAQMYGMISHVDHSIGRVLRRLAERGLLDETLILFTSDHGELLGDHGLLLKGPFYYQSLLNIPLIVRCPSLPPAVNADLAAHVDLVPTILDVLGLPAAEYLPGRSLRPPMEGRAGAVRETVLTEFRPFDMAPMKVLHWDRWKYVYYHGADYGELFDLQEDPQERKNLYSVPAYAETRRDMHGRLLAELVETEAPWPAKGPWR